ncbi:hypothetical protein ACFQZX_17360 [Mucilaginibacter litoreus]|uniref:Uncharacterized protein n=1 Tax=Mucilaginibacter litoreus TaxID=1048221 RepID=A0ABW3AYG6_9SPHI
MPKTINKGELEKGKSHMIARIIQYVQDAVVIKPSLKKTTGSIYLMSYYTGLEFLEKTSAFDTFAQIIESSATIFITAWKSSWELTTVSLFRRTSQVRSNRMNAPK